jgi:hypothetical protein
LVGALVAAAFAAGCSHAEYRQFHDAETHIAFRYPADWFVTGFSQTVSPERLVVASYRVTRSEVEGDCGGSRALAARSPHDVAVLLIDYGPPVAATEDFPPRSRHLSLRLGTYGDYECFGAGYMLRFYAAGHDLQAHVAIGRRADAKLRRQALAILDSLKSASIG